MNNLFNGIKGMLVIVAAILILVFGGKFLIIALAGVVAAATAAMPFILGLAALWAIGWVYTHLTKKKKNGHA
jgi:uncharacterized membrane protein YuzA (DUF378 family)